MTDRFDRLFSLPNILYKNDAPVAILAGVLLKDTQTGTIITQLKFQNLSSKIIKAVKISLSAYDVSGKALTGIEEYQYLDMSIEYGGIFGTDKAIVMPNHNSRTFAIGSIMVIFSDNSSWEESGEFFCALPTPQKLIENYNDDLIYQYKILTTNKAIFIPQDRDDMWICTCGGISKTDVCSQCKCSKHTVFSSCDATALTYAMNVRIEKIKLQKEKEAHENKRKTKIAIIIASIILTIVIVFSSVSIYFSVSKENKYEKAIELARAGDYKQALSLFEEIDNSGYIYSLCKDAMNGSYSGIIKYFNLDTFVIPDGVTSVGKDAFVDYHSLTSITIPNSVRKIEEGAFENFSSLEKVNITDIANWCTIEFAGTNPLYFAGDLYLNGNLVTELVIPNSVTNIEERAFYRCSSLTNVTIPDSTKSIGEYAFWNCENLTGVTIGNGVTSIDKDAFSGCKNLKTITLGNSVTSIGEDAFNGCENLKTITLGNSVKAIGGSAFSGCSSLTSIIIPDNVTSISDLSFYECKNLTSVTIGNGVTSIGKNAFNSCNKLTSIIIPNKVTSIGEGAFQWCSGLTKVTLGNGVTSIGKNAFNSCNKLTSIIIPNKVTSIGEGAFQGCSSLTKVSFGNNITSIGDSVFDIRGSLAIQFDGSKQEFKAIKKDSHWITAYTDATVYCNDGVWMY